MILEARAKIEDALFVRSGICRFGSVILINPEEEPRRPAVLLSNSRESFWNPGAATYIDGELRGSGSLNMNLLCGGVSETVLTIPEILCLGVGSIFDVYTKLLEQFQSQFVNFYIDLDAEESPTWLA